MSLLILCINFFAKEKPSHLCKDSSKGENLMMNEAEHHGIEPEPRARPCPSAIDGMLHISTPCKLPATVQRSTHYFQSAPNS